MPDDKVKAAPHGEPEPQVGDAGLLFQDRSPAQPRAAAPQPVADSGEVFDLVDAPDVAADSAPAQTPSVPRARPTEPAAGQPETGRATARARDDTRLDPSALVEETWSRWAEWGTSLIVVGAWSTAMLLLVYVVFGTELHALAFLLLLIGVIVAVVLSYPILITLERPVRITPEQALRDYYGALSHHLPHFRRMWLLLSTAGRISGSYGSFAGFKGYWKEQLANSAPRSCRAAHAARFRSDRVQVREERRQNPHRCDVFCPRVRSRPPLRRRDPQGSRVEPPWSAGPITCGTSKTEPCLAAARVS